MNKSTEQLDVQHLDDDLLVINKAPGLLSQEDRTGDADVLRLGKALLKRRGDLQQDPYLALIHRLDRPASGLMVLARNPDAARDLNEQFRNRFVEKKYLAQVEGALRGVGRFEDFIAKEDEQVSIVDADESSGKFAALNWQVLGQAEGVSLVQVQLETGRPHQIRVQFASRGHPIVGDVRYGAETSFPDRSIALHAYHLAVEHPSTQRMERWSVQPPPTWKSRFADEISRLVK